MSMNRIPERQGSHSVLVDLVPFIVRRCLPPPLLKALISVLVKAIHVPPGEEEIRLPCCRSTSIMSYRPRPPGSPGLPPTLYSGMSSLRIDQRGTGYGGLQQPLHPTASQPHKALLKTPKAEHAQRPRKSDHLSSSAPWKDPRQAAATSAEHRHIMKDEIVTRRIVKDEAVARQMSPYWSVFPPDARSSSRRETEEMLRTFKDCLREEKGTKQELLAAYEQELDNERKLDSIIQTFGDGRREREDVLLQLLEMAPNDNFRRECQKGLDAHYHHCKKVDNMLRETDLVYPPRHH